MPSAPITEKTTDFELFNPQRWGLPMTAVGNLAESLREIWERFHSCFTTRTRDTSEYAWVYLRGILTMETDRNYSNIARRVLSPDDDGQNLQQFMSDSPWSERLVFEQIQREIQQRPALADGMLTLDESGDERAGAQSAGAGRQYLGRMGKVEMGQVGVALGYYAANLWTMVDAELYLPEHWFNKTHKKRQQRWHIPEERQFLTKPKIGLELIRRAKANGLSFSVVSCDSLYGRDSYFRGALNAENVLYMADIPANTEVYLHPPTVGIVPKLPKTPGRPPSRNQVLSQEIPIQVRTLLTDSFIEFESIAIRYTERGLLTYDCKAQRVWTLTPDCQVKEEWLFIRREPDNTFSFSLSNAPINTPLFQLASWRCQRYFVERTFQDAKSEAGWDELVALKYRAWMHHTALDALALWFVALLKLDWAQNFPRDITLKQQLEVPVLPALSMANVREMLRAVLPLKQLSPEEAIQVVIRQLVNRASSTRSRLKAQLRNRGST